eukprot:COSAG06_NODE_16692_length_986_cov_1.705750_1_plen_203_part_00
MHALLCSAVPIFWVPWILASAFHLQASAECETAAGAVNIPGVCVLDETTTIEGLQRCEKRHFLSHLYIKTNILPRQARDKHRENSKKSGVFRRAACEGASWCSTIRLCQDTLGSGFCERICLDKLAFAIGSCWGCTKGTDRGCLFVSVCRHRGWRAVRVHQRGGESDLSAADTHRLAHGLLQLHVLLHSRQVRHDTALPSTL